MRCRAKEKRAGEVLAPEGGMKREELCGFLTRSLTLMMSKVQHYRLIQNIWMKTSK